MSEVKIAFFDIDGTMIDIHTKRMTEKMKYTLAALRQNGIKVCVATGRSVLTLPKFDEGVEFDAHLTYNGSYCYCGDEVIFSNPIPGTDVKKIIDNAASIGRPVSIASLTRLTANGSDKDLRDYYAISKLNVDVDDDFEEVASGDVYQVMMGLNPDEHAAILKGVENAKIVGWWDRAVDVIPKNGGKGIGIRKILEYYNFSREEAIAFGDGANDIEMLEAVGCGIVMENGTEETKRIADEICGRCDEDGIYHYCVKHGLIDEMQM